MWSCDVCGGVMCVELHVFVVELHVFVICVCRSYKRKLPRILSTHAQCLTTSPGIAMPTSNAVCVTQVIARHVLTVCVCVYVCVCS